MNIEATIYRRALTKLNTMAVDNRRKALDRQQVREITQQALENGLAASREAVDR